ncbi:hypothetical protein PanWU01x14_295560 [Parasponia andersonii]|uniref:Uncharacterized protein n=1 Tax=Parasponia andersonii TaxID=3476 RepID=A0A2P5AVZ0_PARAD|nr:hypothetical protein PanWU01x14_295560 [Parasponia andersonii]
MGLQMVVGVVKMKMVIMGMMSSHSHYSQRAVRPMVAGLLFPFVLKISLSFTVVRRTYCELMHASSLFFFQLGHIAFDTTTTTTTTTTTSIITDGHDAAAAAASSSSSRFRRALRLVFQRLTLVPQPHQQAADSLHSLSMIAL